MRKITNDELKVLLRKHKLWLIDDPEGERADLSGADLRGADLSRADLSRADLYEANLSGADLRGADLSRADLYEANLSGADLYEANLYGADLRGANLYGADLSGANLSGANLSGADLYGADLRGANLRGANLYGANLYGADLYGANLSGAQNVNCPIACPEEGAFIGFKKCHNNLIVKLEITEDALRCSAAGRKCRCSKAKVLSITNTDGSSADVASISSRRDPNFVYTVGEIIEIPDFDTDRWNECSTGIHFFITRQEAVDYNY